MSKSGKDILFVLNLMVGGGAERVISILANHYAKKGWNVSILLRRIDVAYPLDERIKIIEIGMCRKNHLQWIGSIRKYINEHPGAIIVSFQSMMNIYSVIATRGKNVKLIISERNDIKLSSKRHIFLLAKKLYPKADAIVFQSNKVMNYFNEDAKSKGHIILNPVSVAVSANTDNKEKKIVNCGRLAPQKNQLLLIRAFANVAQKYPDYNLYIYGEGKLRSTLISEIDKLGLRDKVFLPGNVADIHERISDAEMFVLSSDFEGLSNALLESMMMGLPCISTNCAGSDEIIVDGENGLLVQVGDLNSLYEAMIKLIDNQELRHKISRGAVLSSEQFKYENVISHWETVIEGEYGTVK